MSVLNKSYFHDEAAAFERMESLLWPDGPVCPHCGGMSRVYVLRGQRTKPSKKSPEGLPRHGLKKCGNCRKQFTVRVGTVFEDSHAPLHKWFQAIHLLSSSKKGMSSHQLHRMLEVQYNTAWFMSHRIREAMRKGPLAPMGGAGEIVEVDETVIGKSDDVGSKEAKYTRDRNIVLTLVNRQGEARSFHVDQANGETIVPIVRANVDAEVRLMTDQATYYGGLDVGFAGRDTVDHSKHEYARGEITTNTV